MKAGSPGAAASGIAMQAGRAVLVLAVAAMALPWLFGRASGPSASVEPWLFGAACAALLALLGGPMAWRPGLALPALAALVWLTARSGSLLEAAAAAGGVLAVYCAASFLPGRGGDGRDAQDRVAAVAAAWMLAALASTLIALGQYFGLADRLAPFASFAAAGEAYANLRQRNQFASLTVIGMAAVLWWVRRGGPLAACAPAAVVLAIGNAAAGSRTGLLGLVLLLVLAMAWPGRSRRQVGLLLLALAAYAAAALVLPQLLLQWTGVEGPSLWRRVAATDTCSSRAVLWSNVLHLVAQRPWAGWGWGELDYAHFATLYAGPRFCDILDNAHNLPLHLAVELGLPVAAAVCLAVLAVVLRQRPWAESDSGRQLAWSVLVMLGLHSLLEYPLWYAPFQLALGLAIGLLWRTAPAAQPAADRAWTPARWAVPVVFALALAFAAWDYQRVSQIYLPPESRRPAWQDDTLEHARRSRLFASPAAFAELTLAPLSRANADWNYLQARTLLHYSPEPRIVERAIESATLLGRDDAALWYLVRYRAAFPQAHAEWARGLGAQGAR